MNSQRTDDLSADPGERKNGCPNSQSDNRNLIVSGAPRHAGNRRPRNHAEMDV